MDEPPVLLTPGPVALPPEVISAMERPMEYHRSATFQDVYGGVLEKLQRIARTSSEVVLFTSSGTGALESAVSNLVSPADRVLVVSAGYFGERWGAIAEAYGAEVDALHYEWGRVPDPDEVAARLAASPADIVFFTQCETSTGVVSDVSAIAAVATAAGALSVVDCVSGLGAVPLEMDEWGVDVVVSGSQKALLTPPGLALAAFSGRARDRALSTSRAFYFSWERAVAAQESNRSPFTPAVSLVWALDAATDIIMETGVEAMWERSRGLGAACRAGVQAAGLSLFSPDADASSVVTAVAMPESVDGQEVVARVRSDASLAIAGGQGELRGRIVRIGHIGWITSSDLAAGVRAVAAAVTDGGYRADPDAGHAAVLAGAPAVAP